MRRRSRRRRRKNPSRVTRSATMLNPTVRYVKFQYAADLQNYGFVCFSD